MSVLFKSAALVAAIALSGFAAAKAAPESLKLQGLKAPVQAAMDLNGVWHIEGKSAEDVVRAQGYMTAKYRLFQMDVFRRRALGTRAELMGRKFVDDDNKAKFLMVELVAPKIWEQLSPQSKGLINAFTEGANLFINSPEAANLPEYKALKVKPMPWRPTDTIAIGRAMSWSLSGGFPDELLIGLLKQLIGAKKFDELKPQLGIDPITISAVEKEMPTVAGFENEILELANMDLFKNKFRPGNYVGSNNWVVSGKRTPNGMPLLANDPHLGLDVPPIWILVHLTAPGLNVSGVTFAGTPGVVIGQNDYLGWGVTTTGYDVTDAYIMKMNPRNNNEYVFGKEMRKVEEIPYTLRINEDGVIKEEQKKFRRTHFGPIALEKNSGVSFGKTIAFRWTGHDPSTEIETFMLANFAKNLSEFKKALSHFKTGAQNFVYLDLKGNIFYHAHADVPIRAKNTVPYLPMDGSNPDHQWKGYVPYNKLPMAENPKSGFVATANNRPAPRNYPYYIGMFFDGGLRARRITDLILAKQKHDPKSFMDLQMDNYQLFHKKFAPRFIKALSKLKMNPTEKQAYEQLKKWDGHTHVHSKGPYVFFKLLKWVNKKTFEDDIKNKMALQEGGSRFEVIGDILRREMSGTLKNPWFDNKDTAKKEDLDTLVRLSWGPAVEEMVKILGKDPTQWTWGKIHQITLSHDFLKEYDRGPIPGPGGYGTVNNAGFGLMGDRMDYGGGPSVRLVMQATKGGIKMWGTLPGADISDWKSKDAADLLDNWMKGKFFEFDNKAGRAMKDTGNKRRLTFIP